MPSLVAILATPERGFVDHVLGAWEHGDAVFPLDPRLPRPAANRLLRSMRPASLVAHGGERLRLPNAVPVEPGDAMVIATSGTTGEPRGAALTHAAIGASAVATSARLDVDPDHDRWLACLPLAHIGGLSVVLRAIVTGTPFDLAPTFDPQSPATLVSLVPTQLERHDTSRFRVVLVGGSADWRERPANVVRTYGMTETSSGVVYDGRPLDGVDVRVDHDGQILLRGPMLLRAYRDGTDPKSSEGWLATGDAGELSPDGLLAVHGRLGDVIVTGGEKVWPASVEAVLRTHPEVADVAVVGVSDAEWGERVVAVVVPRSPSRPPTLDDVREHVAAELASWCAPKELRMADELPRTPSGKVRRSGPRGLLP